MHGGGRAAETAHIAVIWGGRIQPQTGGNVLQQRMVLLMYEWLRRICRWISLRSTAIMGTSLSKIIRGCMICRRHFERQRKQR